MIEGFKKRTQALTNSLDIALGFFFSRRGRSGGGGGGDTALGEVPNRLLKNVVRCGKVS